MLNSTISTRELYAFLLSTQTFTSRARGGEERESCEPIMSALKLVTIHSSPAHLRRNLHHLSPSSSSLSPHRSLPPRHSSTRSRAPSSLTSRRNFSPRAFYFEFDFGSDSDSDSDSDASVLKLEEQQNSDNGAPKQALEYPSGEFEFKEFDSWKKFLVKCRMAIAWPWERVKKGSVLTFKLGGEIPDQFNSWFEQGLSLPQICENFVKAAYDPRIAGVYLHIEPLDCGWAKIDEIRRHILDFRKSGKFIVGYLTECGEKEYYLACACGELYAPPSAYFQLYGLAVEAPFLGGVFEKLGIEPQIERIGRYKSAGDQLARKSISPENREMLTTLLDNIYQNWLDEISTAKGKTREDVENFINEGVYQVQKLKEAGWITDIYYDDEIISMLKERLGIEKDKNLPTVDYRRYSRVRKWTLGLSGGKDKIAIIRASGSIIRVPSPLSSLTSDIVAEQLIEKIRSVRESKKYKAVILRIDSPGGDALASDLMWREIKLLAAKLPVIASMGDVAASGGYCMAMGAGTIVAENLTLTGSIGVVTGKFNLGKLYERIGFNKEIISRGKYAELTAAEQRPFRPEEAELFAKFAQHEYAEFRDKAAYSRSMPVDKMEENAQGRVWTGNDAASRGLVDAIGGMGRAIAIAKQKANIPQEKEVTLVDLSRASLLLEIIGDMETAVDGVVRTLKLLHNLTSSEGVQARLDGIIFERIGAASFRNPIIGILKAFLGSLLR